jgi:aminoglycoside phosphotransferase family enzyme
MIAKTIRLPEALADSRCYPHLVSCVTVIETHISWVLLTGDYAYKIKKPVNLGFLDFTTLASRRHYCEEELRLNRRLAPELYLEVVAIAGTPQRPLIGGPGPAIEYAVKMKEFPQSALLGNALASGELDCRHGGKTGAENCRISCGTRSAGRSAKWRHACIGAGAGVR